MSEFVGLLQMNPLYDVEEPDFEGSDVLTSLDRPTNVTLVNV